jgi:hypothetical protein
MERLGWADKELVTQSKFCPIKDCVARPSSSLGLSFPLG